MKRNLFAELNEGLEALAQERHGKRTLRTTRAQARPVAEVTPQEVKELRERFNLSQPVFAMRLRTNTKTLQNWEQGRSRPNPQAALLIRMMERYPDTAERLASV